MSSSGSHKKFAVGHFYRGNENFQETIFPYLDSIAEVYFAWPGLKNARSMEDQKGLRERITADMLWSRQHGCSLDLLINALCFGEHAFTIAQHNEIVSVLSDLDRRGILPDTVTVISPFLAEIVKREFPQIETRASVNMRVDCTIAMEYLSNIFDGFYISRDLQRDIPTLSVFRKWADKNGKKLCFLANGSCLRNCPYHFYHETLNSHGLSRTVPETKRTGIQPSRCVQLYRKKHFIEILRSSWIRPEDLHLYEDYADLIKLSTRQVISTGQILKAYTERHFDGNLLELLDPVYTSLFYPRIINNSLFPSDWGTSGIGGKCAANCTHCGRCEKVLQQVLTIDPSFLKKSTASLSFRQPPLVIQ